MASVTAKDLGLDLEDEFETFRYMALFKQICKRAEALKTTFKHDRDIQKMYEKTFPQGESFSIFERDTMNKAFKLLMEKWKLEGELPTHKAYIDQYATILVSVALAQKSE